MALSAGEHEKVLDMCASPGGKSTYIAARMKNTGMVVSNDANEVRGPRRVAQGTATALALITITACVHCGLWSQTKYYKTKVSDGDALREKILQEQEVMVFKGLKRRTVTASNSSTSPFAVAPFCELCHESLNFHYGELPGKVRNLLMCCYNMEPGMLFDCETCLPKFGTGSAKTSRKKGIRHG
eukprot:703712-Hanusia_phi.AAC.2